MKKKKQYVVIFGNLTTGVENVTGPYTNKDSAEDYAIRSDWAPGYVMELVDEEE